MGHDLRKKLSDAGSDQGLDVRLKFKDQAANAGPAKPRAKYSKAEAAKAAKAKRAKQSASVGKILEKIEGSASVDTILDQIEESVAKAEEQALLDKLDKRIEDENEPDEEQALLSKLDKRIKKEAATESKQPAADTSVLNYDPFKAMVTSPGGLDEFWKQSPTAGLDPNPSGDMITAQMRSMQLGRKMSPSGTCSLSPYTTKEACEGAGGKWTPETMDAPQVIHLEQPVIVHEEMSMLETMWFMTVILLPVLMLAYFLGRRFECGSYKLMLSIRRPAPAQAIVVYPDFGETDELPIGPDRV